jgi:hypothetical protein
MQDEELEEIKVVAQKLYPGRSWDLLLPEEQKAVYQSYSSLRDQAQGNIAQGQDLLEGKRVGEKGSIYVAPSPWQALAGGIQQGIGHYQLGKANRQEAQGRGALADLQTRRDALDEAERERRRREEEERNAALIGAIRGNYS